MKEEDFEPLFAKASDPLIWEQHPARERYKREVFEGYFRGGMESKGAFVILDAKDGEIIGSSRFCDYDEKTSSVEVGYTFLARKYWGGEYNRELKKLMLDYAFQYIDTVYFIVGEKNQRSRKAMLKIGGLLVSKAARPIDAKLQ